MMISEFRKGLRTSIVGERRTIAGTVYGTIIVMSILADEGSAYKHDLWRLAAITALTSVVVWLAHVYAVGLGESLRRERRVTLPELRSIAAHEYPMVAASILPVMVVVLGAIGVLEGRVAIWLALGMGAVALGAQGVRYARMERIRRGAELLTVGAQMAIGLALVGLEVLIAH